jgi:DNA-binding NtrC family response regulator
VRPDSRNNGTGEKRVNKARIVVADNRADVLEVLVNLLDLMNIEAIPCKTGDEALERVAEGGIDAVISDVRMPIMDGMVLADRLKERFPDLPLIMMSSYASETLETEAKQRGAIGLVAKPFKISQITRLLEVAGLQFATAS